MNPEITSLATANDKATLRVGIYWLIGLGMTLGLLSLNGQTWHSDGHLHTLLETIATVLAMTVGALALVRFYSNKDRATLLLGTGFLGAAFFDGFHGVVTSEHVRSFMPSDLPSLDLWSWVASRQFLSVMIFLSLLAWKWEKNFTRPTSLDAKYLYLIVAVFTLVCFVFFGLSPLPEAYLPDSIFHRPGEFGPAFFFLLALAGFLRKGHWRHDPFEHWLVLSLTVGFIGQAVFMSQSTWIFDYDFDIAHLLKITSYVCVLTGLTVSMFDSFSTAQRNEARIKAVIETSLDGFITIDEKGFVTSIDRSGEETFGYSADEIIGQNVKILMPEKDALQHDSRLANHIRTGEITMIGKGRELTARRKDGSNFPIEIRVVELPPSKDGRGFVGAIRDISERRAAEEELKEKTDIVNLLQATTAEANATNTFEEAIRNCLAMVVDFTGWSVGHIYVLSDKDKNVLIPSGIWHVDDPQRFAVFIEATEKTIISRGSGLSGQVLETGEPAWLDDITKKANFSRGPQANAAGLRSAFAFPVLADSAVIAVLEFFDEQTRKPNEQLLMTFHHISIQLSRVFEREQQQRALNGSQQRFRDFADAASDWFWELDENLRMSYMSQTFFVLSGIPPEDVIGKTRLENPHIKHQEQTWKPYNANLKARLPFKDFIFEILTPAGEELHLSISGRPYFDENDVFQGYRGVGSDVTQTRKPQEELIAHRDHLEALVLERTAEIERQSQQVEKALEQEKENNATQREFVAMASHEFRTPLAIIDGTAQRVVRRLDKMPPDDLKIRMTKIRAAVVRMTELIEGTLSSARIDAGTIEKKAESVDLVALVSEICIRQQEISTTHDLSVKFDDDVAPILGDPTLLDRVFTNLISNSVKYSPDNPRIDVRGFIENEHVVITFSDHGVGIPATELPKLFKRYFRASTASGIAGTGIGLSLVKELVEMHDGRVKVESDEGVGSTFTVYLPRSQSVQSMRDDAMLINTVCIADKKVVEL